MCDDSCPFHRFLKGPALFYETCLALGDDSEVECSGITENCDVARQMEKVKVERDNLKIALGEIRMLAQAAVEGKVAPLPPDAPGLLRVLAGYAGAEGDNFHASAAAAWAEMMEEVSR